MNRRTVIFAGLGLAAATAGGVYLVWDDDPTGLRAAWPEVPSEVFDAFEHDLLTVEDPLLAIRHFGLDLEGLFLMSTDLFTSGKLTRYVMLYHPYAHPCYRPF